MPTSGRLNSSEVNAVILNTTVDVVTSRKHVMGSRAVITVDDRYLFSGQTNDLLGNTYKKKC